MNSSIFALSFLHPSVFWLGYSLPTYKVNFLLSMGGAPDEVPLDPIDQLSGVGGQLCEMHDMVWDTA